MAVGRGTSQPTASTPTGCGALADPHNYRPADWREAPNGAAPPDQRGDQAAPARRRFASRGGAAASDAHMAAPQPLAGHEFDGSPAATAQVHDRQREHGTAARAQPASG